MSTVAAALVTLDEFFEMPAPEDGAHLELHDGEVVVVNPSRPIHIYIQSVLTRWLTDAARGCGWAHSEFPYRPAANLQFWYADVAYVPAGDWQALRGQHYPIYAPPLVVEVLSPSNRVQKLNRQRVAAFSAGTQEFWVIDPDVQTVEVSRPGVSSLLYGPSDSVPLTVLPGSVFPVRLLFE